MVQVKIVPLGRRSGSEFSTPRETCVYEGLSSKKRKWPKKLRKWGKPKEKQRGRQISSDTKKAASLRVWLALRPTFPGYLFLVGNFPVFFVGRISWILTLVILFMGKLLK